MNRASDLDPALLLRRVARCVPPALRGHVVIIGSIAAAWAFRDLSGGHTVATKDIDVLLQPAVGAVANAQILAQGLFEDGWQPFYPNDLQPAGATTPDDQLPALRLIPPGDAGRWFLELLAEPPAGQTAHRHWRRFRTRRGDFGLPSFRFLPFAVHAPDETGFGLRIARPANMALAHLLEHEQPDATPISGLAGRPPRYVKDVGRAVSLWWLAQAQTPWADGEWHQHWQRTFTALDPGGVIRRRQAALTGLQQLADGLPLAHAMALNSILAPHGTTLEAFRRAYDSLRAWIASSG